MKKDIFDFSWIPSSGGLYELYNALPQDSLVGAEIGTRTGSNLLHILRNSNKIKSFIVIDPYCAYQDGDLEVTQEDQNLVKDILLYRVERNGFKDKVEFIFKMSDDAVNEIQDEYLDFIYIDGDHSEEAFRKDFYNYFKKVKSGGIISGHDASWVGVNKVLVEFINQTGKDILWDQNTDSWYFYKN